MKPAVDIRSDLDIDWAARLLSFSFEDKDKGKDKVKIKLENGDLDLIDWFPPGATAAVRWGYPGNMTPWRVIQFTAIKGFREITFEARSLEAVLDRVERVEAYSGTYSQIVQRIVQDRYGFSGRMLHVDDTDTAYDMVCQMAETDAVFLNRLASEEGFVFYIDDTGLHWHAPKYDAPPIRVIEWKGPGENNEIIGEPRLDFDMMRHYSKVKKKALDPEAKKELEPGEEKGFLGIIEELADTLTDTDAKELGKKVASDQIFKSGYMHDPVSGEFTKERVVDLERFKTFVAEKALGSENPEFVDFAKKLAVDPGIAKQMNPNMVQKMIEASEKVMAHGSALKKKRALAAVRIKVGLTLVGDPSLRAKEVIRFLGLPKILEGNFYIKRCTHEISAGYETKLELRKHNPEANPKKGKLDKTGAQVNAYEVVKGGKPKTVIYHDPVTGEFMKYQYPPGFVGPT